MNKSGWRGEKPKTGEDGGGYVTIAWHHSWTMETKKKEKKKIVTCDSSGRGRRCA